MPSVNDPRHESVLNQATNCFELHGCITDELTYHDNMHRTTVDLLMRSHKVSAHLLRTRSDRVAVRKSDGDVMWYDAKTTHWDERKGQDFPIEAMPYYESLLKWNHWKCATMFCCSRNQTGTTYGVFPDVNRVRKVMIPRHNKNADMWVRKFRCINSEMHWEIDVIKCNANGSGDALVALDVNGCDTFEEEIKRWATQ